MFEVIGRSSIRKAAALASHNDLPVGIGDNRGDGALPAHGGQSLGQFRHQGGVAPVDQAGLRNLLRTMK